MKKPIKFEPDTLDKLEFSERLVLLIAEFVFKQAERGHNWEMCLIGVQTIIKDCRQVMK